MKQFFHIIALPWVVAYAYLRDPSSWKLGGIGAELLMVSAVVGGLLQLVALFGVAFIAFIIYRLCN